MWDCVLDALLDTLKVFPLLLLVYLLVEYVSHHKKDAFSGFSNKNKWFGPLVSAGLGVIPQCGFSGALADQYSKKNITLGSLIAVFVATSDEAIPLMIAQPTAIPQMLLLLGIKFGLALLFGYAIDLVLAKKQKRRMQNELITEDEEHHEHQHCCADNIFVESIKHTLKIIAFVFVSLLVLNLLVFFIGTDRLASALQHNEYLSVFLASLIGLIPTCAPSVLLVEMFLSSLIPFSVLLAGLISSAGIGLLVLAKENKNVKQNLLIVGILLGIALVSGFVTALF